MILVSLTENWCHCRKGPLGDGGNEVYVSGGKVSFRSARCETAVQIQREMMSGLGCRRARVEQRSSASAGVPPLLSLIPLKIR